MTDACAIPSLTAGDDWVRPVRLSHVEDGVRSPYAILSGSQVAARLMTRGRDADLIAETVCSSDHPDADWPNGVVAVQFPRAQTVGLSQQRAELKITVDDGTLTSWWLALMVIG